MFDSPLAALVVVMMVNFKLKEKHKNLLEIFSKTSNWKFSLRLFSWLLINFY